MGPLTEILPVAGGPSLRPLADADADYEQMARRDGAKRDAWLMQWRPGSVMAPAR